MATNQIPVLRSTLVMQAEESNGRKKSTCYTILKTMILKMAATENPSIIQNVASTLSDKGTCSF